MLQQVWYQIGRWLVTFFVRCILRADVRQSRALPRGAKILIANHPSTSDPAYVTVLLREQASILIKDTLFAVPLFGRSLRLAGHVPVAAGHGCAALDEAIRLVRSGRTVILFPEGEISPAGGFHPAHSGAARLALATGVPVIPVGISLDPRKIRWLSSRVNGQAELGAWYLQGPYAMTVGSALVFSGSPEDHDLVRHVTRQMMQQIVALSQHSALRLTHANAARPVGSAVHLARRGFALPGTAWRMAHRGARQGMRSSIHFVGGSAVYRGVGQSVESVLAFLMIFGKTLGR